MAHRKADSILIPEDLKYKTSKYIDKTNENNTT